MAKRDETTGTKVLDGNGGTRRKVGECKEALRVELTPKENQTAARRFCDLTRDIERIEAEKKHAAELFKSKISKIKTERDQLGDAVTRGWEDRDITVESWLTPHGTIDLIRLDTGEVIRTRQAAPSELQEDLFT